LLSYHIGLDTGGTFTDCVIIDEIGNVALGKAPSTPDDFSRGIMDAIQRTGSELGLGMSELLQETTVIAHAATTATNALLTGKGRATAALITTAGFEDTLPIMRASGRNAGLGEAAIKRQVKANKPRPLVPRSLIRGLNERIDYTGRILVPLDRAEVEAIVEELLQLGVESMAVSLIWAHRNPEHESAVLDVIRSTAPDLPVSLGGTLAPVMGEYERTATAAANAVLAPMVSQYLSRFSTRLEEAGYRGATLVAQAHGGMLGLSKAAERPVSMIHSGPVCGIMASQYLAGQLGYRNAIATDMGGTSFDVGVIYRGTPEPARETIIDQYSLRIPMLAMDTIGAGAGSIAWVEPSTGRLHVGPQSAGASPGPACYGTGGKTPTVTDANVVLGLLNPDGYLGGSKPLDRARAVAAIEEYIAGPLGIAVEAAASGIHEIANAHMADLIRATTVGRGMDPRRCALFAYGGAGPLHAYGFGQQAERVVVPAAGSVFSAMGCAIADIVHAYEVSVPMQVPAHAAEFNSVFARLEQQAAEEMDEEGFSADQISLRRYVTMRHRRQVHEVRVPVPAGVLDATALDALYAEFEAVYERKHGRGSAFREAGQEIVSFIVEATGVIGNPGINAESERAASDPSVAFKGQRRVVLHREEDLASIYAYEKLRYGNVIQGPAIIESSISTIVVDASMSAEVDNMRNVHLRWVR
jgi:N-methylhydantoinase A